MLIPYIFLTIIYSCIQPKGIKLISTLEIDNFDPIIPATQS